METKFEYTLYSVMVKISSCNQLTQFYELNHYQWWPVTNFMVGMERLIDFNCSVVQKRTNQAIRQYQQYLLSAAFFLFLIFMSEQ